LRRNNAFVATWKNQLRRPLMSKSAAAGLKQVCVSKILSGEDFGFGRQNSLFLR